MNLSRFFGELKRRKVYTAAVAYLVGGWALAQGLSQLLPLFDIPIWVVRLVVLVIVLGFPVALGLSWFAKDRFRAYPVDRCGEHLKRLCPSFYNHLSSWYEPNRARRSFFLSSGDRLPRSAKSFGRPVRTYRFSGLRSDLKLYVYDYDIATRIGPR